MFNAAVVLSWLKAERGQDGRCLSATAKYKQEEEESKQIRNTLFEELTLTYFARLSPSLEVRMDKLFISSIRS